MRRNHGNAVCRQDVNYCLFELSSTGTVLAFLFLLFLAAFGWSAASVDGPASALGSASTAGVPMI